MRTPPRPTWQISADASISRHNQVFQQKETEILNLFNNKHYADATTLAEILGFYAWMNHTGHYASPTLENTLLEIGRQTVPVAPKSKRPKKARPSVLHVMTQAYAIGGHSRVVWRWMEQDDTRSHSLALTRTGAAVPQELVQQVGKSGGTITELTGSHLARATALRELATGADFIVLHTHSYDVLPLLAFANPLGLPPVILFNQANHLFWYGAQVANVITSFDETCLNSAVRERGIPRTHQALLPLPLTSTPRSLSRPEAKQKLGLPADSTFMLTIASDYKFHPLPDEPGFLDHHLPFVQNNPNVHHWVIGVEPSPYWSAATLATHGRFRIFPPTRDIAIHQQAADIYLDSYPVGSPTSLLESALYETPPVSLRMGSSELRTSDPALTEAWQQPADTTALKKYLGNLLGNPSDRLLKGRQTAAAIRSHHEGPRWQKSLEDIYKKAASTPRITTLSNRQSPISLTDRILVTVYANAGLTQPYAFYLAWGMKDLSQLRQLRAIITEHPYKYRYFWASLVPPSLQPMLRRAIGFIKRRP